MKRIAILLFFFNIILTKAESLYIPFDIFDTTKSLSVAAKIKEPKIIVKKHEYGPRKYIASINGSREKSFLTFGLGLIKTASIIKKYNKQIIRGIVAHEIGHLISKESESLIENEYNADLMALTILGENGVSELCMGICLAHLATELFQIWNSIRFEKLKACSTIDIQHVIEYVTSKIIKKFPSLGNLSKVSDKYFSNTISKIIIDSLNTYETTSDIYIFAKKIYSAIKKECKEALIISETERKESLGFEQQVWNGSIITHPELFLRIENIQKN